MCGTITPEQIAMYVMVGTFSVLAIGACVGALVSFYQMCRHM